MLLEPAATLEPTDEEIAWELSDAAFQALQLC
jgi:hypothetical protein